MNYWFNQLIAYNITSAVYSPFLWFGIPNNEEWSQSIVARCVPHLVSEWTNIPSDPLINGYSLLYSINLPVYLNIAYMLPTTVSALILEYFLRENKIYIDVFFIWSD